MTLPPFSAPNGGYRTAAWVASVTVTLEAIEGGTMLTYEFVSWPPPEDVASSQRGVETMLDSIEDGITRGII